MLSTIRTDGEVKRFWKDSFDRLNALHEQLEDLAADIEQELDDEDSGSPSVEHTQMSGLFKKVDRAYESLKTALEIAKTNTNRVKA